MSNKQVQEGGDESVNFQAGTVIINAGIDEKRAREIYQEMSIQLRSEYSQEALKIANDRVGKFEDKLMPKMERVDGALEAFADPGFQLLLVEAQKTAASTERPADYDLLSELLIHRFQSGDNRVRRAGIGRAIEIVDEIADDALLGLTVVHAIAGFIPLSGDIIHGLDVLNGLFEKMIYEKLPEGRDWIDHLDILDAVRINSFGGLKKIQQFYPDSLGGYVDVGIKKDSDNYRAAIDILKNSNLPQNILVDHYFNKDFVRISTPSRDKINSPFQAHFLLSQGDIVVTQSTTMSDDQISSVKSIYDLYVQDAGLRNKNVLAFMSEWDKRPALKTLREWWDSIPSAFQITSVGKVLAHSNAQRCDKNFPSLN
jgi:hypothetical protein